MSNVVKLRSFVTTKLNDFTEYSFLLNYDSYICHAGMDLTFHYHHDKYILFDDK